jgi:hypothetical protein
MQAKVISALRINDKLNIFLAITQIEATMVNPENQRSLSSISMNSTYEYSSYLTRFAQKQTIFDSGISRYLKKAFVVSRLFSKIYLCRY